MTFDASKLRAKFPALSESTWADEKRTHPTDPIVPVFFDAPGGVQVPKTVIDAIGRYLTKANANFGGHFLTRYGRNRVRSPLAPSNRVHLSSKRTVDVVQSAREAMADYLGTSDRECCVLGPNMTTLTFSVSRAMARSFGWAKGDEIILTRLDHDANVSPWLQIARDVEMVVKFIPLNKSDCTLDLSALPGLLTEKTKLVAVTYASNAVGTINPIKSIAATVHANSKALFFVDAVHFAPHGLIDVVELDVDFLVCSVYKFFGPHVGVLYGKKQLLESIEAYKVRPAPTNHPGKFETGTALFELFGGVTAAVDYIASIPELMGDMTLSKATRREKLASAWKLVSIYESELSHRLISGLLSIPGITFYGIVGKDAASYLGKRTPTVSFILASHTAAEIAEYLATRNVCSWSGNFYAFEVSTELGREGNGGMLRLGCASYTTMEEIDHVVKCLKVLVVGAMANGHA
jgi:cysteine desulfurase family protein (TIGR01976 family)